MRGYISGAITIVEIVALITSPIILPLYGLEYAYTNSISYVWTNLEMYSKSTATYESTLLSLLHESSKYVATAIVALLTDSEDDASVLYTSVLYDNALSEMWFQFVDFLAPALYVPRWVMTVWYATPGVYLDYYYYGKLTTFMHEKCLSFHILSMIDWVFMA